ncbi:MAG TPA: hypothetical protein VG984_01125 [Candidatus Paceibacterota bacterium]|nr:hypothetical protein [Candidatus Paceibacterota bacterium]
MKKLFLYGTLALFLALPFTTFAQEYQGDDLVKGRPSECFIVDNANSLPVYAARIAVPSKNEDGYTYVSDTSPREPLVADKCYEKDAELEVKKTEASDWETVAFDEEQGFNQVRKLFHFELYYDDFGFDYYLYEGSVFEFDNTEQFRDAVQNGFYDHIVPTLNADLAACETRKEIQAHFTFHFDKDADDYRLTYINEVWRQKDGSTKEPSDKLVQMYQPFLTTDDYGKQETLRRAIVTQSLTEAGCGVMQKEYLDHKASDLIAQYVGTEKLQGLKTAVAKYGDPNAFQMHATTTSASAGNSSTSPHPIVAWWKLLLGIAFLLGLALLVRYSPNIGRVAQR